MFVEYKEKFYRWLAHKLPKSLVYHCTIRLMAYGTSGEYYRTNVSSVRAMTLLKRWENK